MSTACGEPVRSIELADRRASSLLIVDVQEKLLAHIPEAEQLVRNCCALVKAAKLLGVPVFATEQYRKGLGPTPPALAELLPQPTEKLRFSCSECLAWQPASQAERHQVVVAGIETHICVLQTTLDLMALGYRVFVPADAVASRKKLDWQIALDRLAASGATVATTESILFEWCETAAAPEFKQISELVKAM